MEGREMTIAMQFWCFVWKQSNCGNSNLCISGYSSPTGNLDLGEMDLLTGWRKSSYMCTFVHTVHSLSKKCRTHRYWESTLAFSHFHLLTERVEEAIRKGLVAMSVGSFSQGGAIRKLAMCGGRFSTGVTCSCLVIPVSALCAAFCTSWSFQSSKAHREHDRNLVWRWQRHE